MQDILIVWAEAFIRWTHVIAGVAWIGSSFYFMHLDYSLKQKPGLPERAHGRRRLPTIPGMVPGIDDRPSGCLFNPRCGFATDLCRTTPPSVSEGTRCHFPRGGAA